MIRNTVSACGFSFSYHLPRLQAVVISMESERLADAGPGSREQYRLGGYCLL